MYRIGLKDAREEMLASVGFGRDIGSQFHLKTFPLGIVLPD
jgi:hypothetical protein